MAALWAGPEPSLIEGPMAARDPFQLFGNTSTLA